jgi:hypothetical protein
MTMRRITHIVLPIALLMGTAAYAEQPTPELQALDDALPGTLINDPTRLDWTVFGPGAASKPIKGDAIPGGKAALQVTVPKAGATLYEIGTNAPITAAIKPGTDLVVAFYARTASSSRSDGSGIIGVRFQQNSAPYPGFGDTTLVIGKDWKLYEVTAKSNVSIPKGQAVVGFQLSGAKQVIEIGQTIVASGATTLSNKSTKVVQSATTDLLPQLQDKGKLISNPANKAWTVYGAAQTNRTVPSPNIPGSGGTALQVTTTDATKNAFDVGANISMTGAVAEGDILLVGVLARTAPGGTGDGTSKLGIRVQLNEAPYPGFGDNMLNVGPSWRLLQLRTQAKMAIPLGKGAVALHFGATVQSIEVGQVYVINTSVPADVSGK